MLLSTKAHIQMPVHISDPSPEASVAISRELQKELKLVTLAAGALELRLVAKGLVLGMRCTSVSLRNKWTALLGKLLRRISTSVHFVLHKWSTGPGTASLGTAEEAERARDIACETPCLLSGVPALRCIALAVCPSRLPPRIADRCHRGTPTHAFSGVNMHVTNTRA